MPGQIKVVHPNLIIVGNVPVNYEQAPKDSIVNGNHHRSSAVPDEFPLQYWSGGKVGQAIIPVLHLVRSDQSLTTQEARLFIWQRGLNPCVPAEIAPLRSRCQQLYDDCRLELIVSLPETDEELWRDPEDQLRVVYLACNPIHRGIMMGVVAKTKIRQWNRAYWFAGTPRPYVPEC